MSAVSSWPPRALWDAAVAVAVYQGTPLVVAKAHRVGDRYRKMMNCPALFL